MGQIHPLIRAAYYVFLKDPAVLSDNEAFYVLSDLYGTYFKEVTDGTNIGDVILKEIKKGLHNEPDS